MTTKKIQKTVSLFAYIWIFSFSCMKPYLAVPPDGFAVYKKPKHEYRAVSSEGVMYRVRHVKNEPFAELKFWHEALKKRMVDAGYRLLSDTTYESGKKKVLLELAAPVGYEDYIYLIDIQMYKKSIIIIEASGESLQFEKHRDAILRAMANLKTKG